MEALKVLCERRSVRSFKPDMPESEKIDAILEAAMNAPTGRNMQAPIILAVTNECVRNELSELNAKILGTDSDPFYGAPAVLVVLADRSVSTHVYDGALVMGNIMNAAEALGLGSCWIHRAKEMFDSKEGKTILNRLGIKGDYEGIGNCIIGYPDGEKAQKRPRKSNYVYYIK